MHEQHAHEREIDEGGLKILEGLPPDLRRRVAEFRVEAYRVSAACAECGTPVLYFSAKDALIPYKQYYVVRGVFLCARCARRPDGTCLCDLPRAYGTAARAA